MPMRDLYSSLDKRLALIPAAQTAAWSGIAINLFGGRSVVFAVMTGALVGAAVFNLKLQHSDDGTTWVDVPLADVQSDQTAVMVANSAYRLGYLGGKQYCRLAGVFTSGTSLVTGAVALVEPLRRPVA